MLLLHVVSLITGRTSVQTLQSGKIMDGYGIYYGCVAMVQVDGEKRKKAENFWQGLSPEPLEMNETVLIRG